VLLVAQTGWGQAQDRARTLEAGFDVHLTKPIDPAVVQDLLIHLKADVLRKT
jgi:CheY-like chemotaxis protein